MTDRLDRIEAQQERNTANIADLITLSSNVLRAVDGLVSRIDESNQRFDVLRDEAIADRRENRELWNDAMTQADADRAEYREKFDQAMAQSDTDRARADKRHAAQMEVIQTLLLELTKSSGNINTLRDRVDTLEQAS